jgi:hypothetical protein
MKFKRSTLLIFSLCISFTFPFAQAKLTLAKQPTLAKKQTSDEPPLKKGWWITVMKLDRKKRLLEIQIDKASAVGPNLARPEDLIEAVGIVEPEERRTFMSDPSRFVGSKFVLEKDLPLVSPYK